MSSQEVIAYGFGKNAYENGKPCAPANDSNFLQTFMVGSKVGDNIKTLKAWNKGWVEASLKDLIV